MKITITLLVVLVVLIAVVGGGAMLAGPQLGQVLSDFKTEPTGTGVRAQTMETTTLVEFVTAPGAIEPHTNVEISSQVSARIEALPVDDGDEVRKGDVIARLDDRDLKAALESAKARRDGEESRLNSETARLVGLNSNLIFARKELERMQSLYGTGDISRRSLDDAELRAQETEANVEATKFTISVIESSLAAAESDIQRAQDGLDNTVILSPMDGTVTAVHMEVGEQVLGTFNNIGSRIMTVADLSRMILKAEVAESDIASVEVGQSAKIHINAYPDVIFGGTVTQIALQRTTSSDGTGVFEVEVEIDLEGRRIRSGHEANVDIEIDEHEGVVVESQAIVERLVEDLPDGLRTGHPLVDYSKRTTTVVYRLIDDKSVCTPVRPGPSDLTRTLVTEGLEPDDVVITGPYKVLEKIKDGEPVFDELAAAAARDEAKRAEEAGERGEPDAEASDDEASEEGAGPDDDGGSGA
ncbi:MAG: efflux RND transporter periplasmic adaptor subunit [Planctomycetota bacterium]